MANNRIVIEGIKDYEILPRELAAAAEPLVRAAAEASADHVRNAYKKISGELRGGVIVRPGRTSNPLVTDAVVYSTAPYAEIYEFGSQQAGGQDARPTFLPITARDRSTLTAHLVAMVRAAGFTVTGDHS